MDVIKTHKDLDVWREAMALAKSVYSLTAEFPKEEVYGLVSQMSPFASQTPTFPPKKKRRSAVSVPSNIAEGAARNSNKDFIRFLYTSLGSLAELETQLLLSRDLGFVESSELDGDIERIRQLLFGLIRYLKRRSDH